MSNHDRKRRILPEPVLDVLPRWQAAVARNPWRERATGGGWAYATWWLIGAAAPLKYREAVSRLAYGAWAHMSPYSEWH